MKISIGEPTVLQIILEKDAVDALRQFFGVSGFSIIEDDTLGDAVFSCHATFLNEVSTKRMLVHVLAPSYGINGFLLHQPLSILMNAIFPTEYICCFPGLLKQQLVLVAPGKIAAEWSRRWESTGLTI
jgi:hypothetical protein